MDSVLTTKETESVLRILKNYLPDLREELGKTDNYDWRQEMKRDAEELAEIISKLEGAVAQTS